MATNVNHRDHGMLRHMHHFRHGSGEVMLEFLLSLVPTALLVGLLWGVGYLFFLLFMNEMA